jgi:hypothetical protein
MDRGDHHWGLGGLVMVNEDNLIGDPTFFDPEGQSRIRRERGVGVTINLDKALWALEYTAQLGRAGLDFVLKGGTAVQLVTDPSWPRFSVDVDICTDVTRDELEGVLALVSDVFEAGFEYEPRKSSRLDSPSFTSYRVTTPPIGGPPRDILLDVSLSRVERGGRSTPLKSFFYDSSATVLTPHAGGLLGDKLTTIPSQTVGRTIRDSRQGLDYAKHVFDIDRLIRSDAQPDQVKEAFETVVGDQNRLRGTDFGLDDVVRDLVSTCETIFTVLNPQGWSPVRTPSISHDLRYLQRIFRRGLRDLRPFLAGGVVFGEEEFVTGAGDAAFIALATSST